MKNQIRERDIEKYLVKKVKEIGGWAPKWISPGNIGVQDRICFFPNGNLVFVELKAPGKQLTPNQRKMKAAVENFGQEVIIIDSKELVDIFIKAVLEVCTKEEKK